MKRRLTVTATLKPFDRSDPYEFTVVFRVPSTDPDEGWWWDILDKPTKRKIKRSLVDLCRAGKFNK